MSDFLIVGGGIAGLSTAAALAPLGEVVLLEAEEALGYHASGRSAAMFLESYGNDVVRALNEASTGGLTSFAGGVLSPRGVLTLARADQTEALDHALDDPGTVEISVSDAMDRVSILNCETVHRVALTEGAQDLDTDRLLQHFRREALAKGARIATGRKVTGIERGATGWVVTSGDQMFAAQTLVNAAGAWADLVAEMAGVPPLGLQPLRRSAARVPAPGGYDTRAWPMLLGAEEDWYAKPDAGAWLISPSEEHPAEPHDAWADDMVLAEGIARYQEMVTDEVIRLEVSWAGLRTFAPDRALVLGPDPAAPDFVWCAGQGGYGFQTCVAASQLLQQGLSGGGTDLPAAVVAALSPGRFS
ncbi:MAG: FAD-dependent oxidoreductase [Pseudomonadota bacterium]